MKAIKTVIGYAACARLHAELGDGVGFVRRMPVRTPYSWTPVHTVYSYRGRAVILAETAHRRYEVLPVAGEYVVRATDELAMADFQAAEGRAS